jgi:exonuclease III
MNILTFAILNINELTSPTHVSMLEAFVRLHELDILLLQEATHPLNVGSHSYTVCSNIGNNRRGTAILARDNIRITNISKLPSGRAIAATLGTLLITNIYVPAGTAKRLEREIF